MREAIEFKVVGSSDPVVYQEIIDEDGSGHDYQIPNFYKDIGNDDQVIHFYRLNEDGANVPGSTNEVVMRVLIDRLKKLEAKFPCRENSIAITKLEEALMWLHKRTEDRIKRGVEGQHKL